VAKLVGKARLLATAAVLVRIQTSLKKIQNGRHKQRSGQNTLVGSAPAGYGSSFGSNPDIFQKYKTGDISKGVANTL